MNAADSSLGSHHLARSLSLLVHPWVDWTSWLLQRVSAHMARWSIQERLADLPRLLLDDYFPYPLMSCHLAVLFL